MYNIFMKSYKFGRLFIGIEGYSLTEDEKNLIKNEYIAGIILFSRNFKDKIQLKKLCREIKSIKENIIISVDQEGGRVQRFIEGFVKLPSLEAIGKIFKINPSNAKKIATWTLAIWKAIIDNEIATETLT